MAGVGAHHPGAGRARAGGARPSDRDCMVERPVSRPIDVMHLGRDRVICAYEIGRPDRGSRAPPPASRRCSTALGAVEPRALLLTHIHLDHAGATGRALPALPGPAGLRARARRAAPDRPLEAAEERRRACTATTCGSSGARWRRCPRSASRVLRGGETVEGFRVAYTPGHASHHVSLPARGHRATPTWATWPACAIPPLRLHGAAHAAARHRRRGLARLAAHDRGLEPARALPHALRPGHATWPSTCTGCALRWSTPARAARG